MERKKNRIVVLKKPMVSKDLFTVADAILLRANTAKIAVNVWENLKVQCPVCGEYFMSYKETIPYKRVFWSNLRT